MDYWTDYFSKIQTGWDKLNLKIVLIIIKKKIQYLFKLFLNTNHLYFSQ